MARSWFVGITLGALLGTASCLRTTEFRCATDSQCGAGGACEAVGFCSVLDSSCSSGVRYSDTAGSYANQCVTGDMPEDAGVDVPIVPNDGTISTGCPGGYAEITGGQGTHRYRRIASAQDWATQRSFCEATSTAAYLAIPDDLGELQAIATLANVPRFWVGISDLATENTFLTVKNAVPGFLPWQAGAPDNGPPPENCVEVISATSVINDARCNTKYEVVCECEP